MYRNRRDLTSKEGENSKEKIEEMKEGREEEGWGLQEIVHWVINGKLKVCFCTEQSRELREEKKGIRVLRWFNFTVAMFLR